MIRQAVRARLLQGIMRRAFTLMHDTLRLVGLLDFDPRALQGRLPQGPAVFCSHAEPRASSPVANHPTLCDVTSTIAAAVERIREGFRAMVLPEGTRSPAGSLHPFGRVAFEIACQADVPLIPVVIRCEPVWLFNDFGLLSPRDELPRMQLVSLEPSYPADCQRSSRKLRDVVEARLRRALAIPVTPSQGLSNGTDASIARASAQESHCPISHARGR